MIARRRLSVQGQVQGVGFRPFVFVLAEEMGLTGFVLNSAQGAEIEIEGRAPDLDAFVSKLVAELPPPGHVASIETEEIPSQGGTGFSIGYSAEEGPKSAVVLPDLAPCAACLRELTDPADRRFGYPFINCTHCGPRYSIIRQLPYDRPYTTMAPFEMCPDCRAEYTDPRDRRFHAQPVACPVCGPRLEFVKAGEAHVLGPEALERAAQALEQGLILALMGVGGFHLMVRADDDVAVRRLRDRKRREAKPLAVMVRDADSARAYAEWSEVEFAALTSPAAPIVIARSRGGLAPSIAPGNPNVGLMLPSSPLHHLLMQRLDFPVVATSGNLSDEPICIENGEARVRLAGVADAFLMHDRKIVRPIDDSVCRQLGEDVAILRRARGYAPTPFPCAEAQPGLAAFGPHMKGSVAVCGSGKIVVGQHVGDLDTVSARHRLKEEVDDLLKLQETNLTRAAHDLHPDYASTLLAHAAGVPTFAVQHHVAHAAALGAERGIADPWLAVVWDGTGLGTDGTIWGGEFFLMEGKTARRVGHLRPFRLVGGDAAARQGFRAALGVLHELGLSAKLDHPQASAVANVLKGESRAIQTTSAGRLFDAVSSLRAGIHESRFEGEAAMHWEFLAAESTAEPYPITLSSQGTKPVLDWGPMIAALLAQDESLSQASWRFHAALASGIVQVARALGVERVGLTGGCFQNQLLARLACQELRGAGFTPFEHREIPPNDGGIAFGQAVVISKGITLVDD